MRLSEHLRILFLFISIFHFCFGEVRLNIDLSNLPKSILVLNQSTVLVVPDSVKSLTIKCVASCPAEWRLQKFRFASFPDVLADSIDFRNTRRHDIADYTNTSAYEYIAEIEFSGGTKLLTGNYSCGCSSDPNTSRSIYVYWEGSSKSYLLQSEEQSETKLYVPKEQPLVTLYCGVSKPGVPVYLFKGDEDTGYFQLRLNESVTSDVDGFHVNTNTLPFPYGNYICSLRLLQGLKTDTNLVRYEILNQMPPEKEVLHLSHINSLREESKNTIFVEPENNNLVCCSRGPPASPPQQVGFWCTNPQKCRYLRFQLINGHNAQLENGTCSSYEMTKAVEPGAATFRCITDELSAEGEMFFSLDGDVYFSKEDIKEESVVRVKVVQSANATDFYVGAPIMFECQRSWYLFSEGIIWVGTFRNGTHFLIDTSKRLLSKEYQVESFNDNVLDVRLLNRNIVEISCMAPVWNTQEWFTSKLELKLAKSRLPSFTDSNDVGTSIYVGSRDGEVSLECRAKGIPLPKITWFKDLKMIPTTSEVINQGTVSSMIMVELYEPLASKLGTYVCVASNSVGESSRTIQVLLKGIGLGVILGITFGVVLVFALVLVILIRVILAQRKAIRHLTQAEIEEFEKGNPEALANWKEDINACSHLLPYNPNYEIPPTELIVDASQILGQGAYGIVMKGTICRGSDRIPVAIKTIKPNQDVSNFKVLLCELKIMAFIGRHENIVSLVGACSRNIRNRELKIAIELCDNGGLFDYLRKGRLIFKDLFKAGGPRFKETSLSIPSEQVSYYMNQPNSEVLLDQHKQPMLYANQMENETLPLVTQSPKMQTYGFSTKHLVAWAIQIANGMEFLGSKKVIHADLATRNVLLTADWNAKIGDFGLSKHLFEYSTYKKKTVALLPWKWMAIESLRDLEFSVKSDVWSFGVTLWEIFTLAQLPYPGTTWNNDFINDLERGLRLSQPQYGSPQVYEIILDCLCPEPQDRPTFTKLKECLIPVLINLKSTT